MANGATFGAPVGVYAEEELITGAAVPGFNIAPLIPRWNAAIAAGRWPMPSFSPSGGLTQLSQSGGWGDVFSAGLGALGQWQANKAVDKQQKRALKLMKLATQGQPNVYGALGGGYQAASSPYMNINPNLGATSTFGLSLGESLPVPTMPGGFPLPTPSQIPDTYDPSTGRPYVGPSFWDIWNAISGGGGGMANPVTAVGAGVARRTSPPRIVGAIDNTTGRSFFYRYVGAPILFRGDLTTLKTAKKAVSKFGGLARATSGFRRRRRR
jgi:hypothetical protein